MEGDDKTSSVYSSAKEKKPDYYHKTRRELEYITSLASSKRECEELTKSEISKEVVKRDSNINTSMVLQTLLANMVSASNEEPDDV